MDPKETNNINAAKPDSGQNKNCGLRGGIGLMTDFSRLCNSLLSLTSRIRTKFKK